MTQHLPFKWAKKAELAARLIAEDVLTDEAIAQTIGRSRAGMTRWRRHPEFMARVTAIRAEYRAAIIAEGIANRQNRVDALNRRWDGMRQVITARASDDTLRDVPGGPTGLLVEQKKISASGAVISEYAVDTALLREMRATEQQAAQELGQWSDRHEHTGRDGQPIAIESRVQIYLPQKDPIPDPGIPPERTDAPDAHHV